MTTNEPRLFLLPFASARERLRSVIAAAKRDDPLAPVTVVVPSSYAGVSLRQDLGRQGLVNVRFEVVRGLAEFIAGPRSTVEGRPRLTSIRETAAVQAALVEASGPLALTRDHPAAHRSLRSTFRELRRATPEALDSLEQSGGIRAEVVRLFRDYRTRIVDYQDDEDLAEAATLALRDATTVGLDDVGAVVLFLVHELTRSERTLIEALAARAPCAAVLGLTGDDDADAPARSLARRLQTVLGAPDEVAPDGPATAARLAVLPDAHEEVRWTIRQVVSASAEGTPLHRIAVLFRQQDPYGGLVRQEFQLAGVPTVGASSTRLGETPAGRTLVGLVELADGRMDRARVMEWLTSCPVKSPDKAHAEFSATQWDALSRRANVVEGLDEWRTRLALYKAEVERQALRSLELEDVTEAGAKRMQAEAAAARALSEFVTDLDRRLNPPSDGATWMEFASWATDLLAGYLDVGESAGNSSERVLEILREIESLDALGRPPTLDRFKLALEDALSATVGHVGRTGEGVFVGPIASVAGMEFDVVHVVGMIEGAVPPRTYDDPLVPDRQRREAGGPEAGLRIATGRQTAERYAYLVALETAPKRAVSYPRADLVGQRGLYPSRWFLESASALEGSPVHSSDLPRLTPRPWMTVVESVEAALAQQAGHADLHDYDVDHVWRWDQAGRRVNDHPLALANGLGRAVAMESERQSGRLTRWDGDASAAAGAAALDPLTGDGMSPTSLQRWARCPFQYFLGKVLGIAALETPDRAATITPLEKGSLIHGVLEQFIDQVQRNGTIPSPGQGWTEADRELLLDIARREFERAESRGLTGKPLLWELEKETIVADLVTFLDEDARLRERFGVAPLHVEARFGIPDADGESWPTVEYPVPGLGSLRFRGIVDRVDVDDDRKSALVLDYKTGSDYDYKGLNDDPVDRGRHLQLPVYALALRAVLGEETEIRAAYWFISSKGQFRLTPNVPPTDREITEPFRQTVSTVVTGIKDGVFPANPGRRDQDVFTNCRFCDFDSLCLSRRDLFWSRKRDNDPRLAPYVDLSEGDR